MTDKQIMINDVDVSRCDFLAKEDDYCSYSGEYRAYKGQCGCSDEEMCKDHPNCYFKQLKRKEKECEELREYHNKCCEEFENEKKELLEKYIQLSRDFYSGKYCNVEKCKQLDQLKAENEELKTMLKDLSYENQKFCYQIEEQTKQLEPFKDEYFKGLDNVVIAELAKKSIRITAEDSKLEQTLAEIKEITKNMNNECFYDDFDCKDCDMKNGCTYQGEIKILQKISEVENEYRTKRTIN